MLWNRIEGKKNGSFLKLQLVVKNTANTRLREAISVPFGFLFFNS